jgi:hypothetical protein
MITAMIDAATKQANNRNGQIFFHKTSGSNWKKKKKKDKSKTSKYSRGIYFIVPKHMRHENQEEEQIHAVSEARTQKRENE